MISIHFNDSGKETRITFIKKVAQMIGIDEKSTPANYEAFPILKKWLPFVYRGLAKTDE